MTISTIIIPILVCLTIVLALTFILLAAKSFLVSSGKVKITINGEKTIEVDGGSTLLTTLGNEGIFLPSACGGGGTCVQCTCQVHSGGGSILPTEEPHFSRKQIADNFRLGCQVKVKEDMEIEVEEEIMGIKEWEATVVSNYNVATYIKEFIVEIPAEGEFLWWLGWRLTTGIGFWLRYRLDYGVIMRYEHVNTASKIIRTLRKYYKINSIKSFPFDIKNFRLYIHLVMSKKSD